MTTPNRFSLALRLLVAVLFLAAALLAGNVCTAKQSTGKSAAAAGDWPCWRGPSHDNHAVGAQTPPLNWSGEQNVLWQVALPGAGHASPCIQGPRIFLPLADTARQTIWLLCLDRASGKTLWQTTVYQGELPKMHPDNSPASATPACDGKRVYFPWQTPEGVHLGAFDLTGKPLWSKLVGPYKTPQGYAASPALYQGRVIVPLESSLGNTLFALDGKTGTEVWRAPLPKGRESYTSPVVAHIAGRDQIVLTGSKTTSAYDPASGKQLWIGDGPADCCVATAAFDQGAVYVSGGYPQKALLAISADGNGDVTGKGLRWKSDNKASYVPSPLMNEGLLYVVNDTGLLRCYDPTGGAVLWEQALQAPFYSSPVLAGDRLYLFDRHGKGYVVEAGRRFKLLATNTLPDGVNATPAIVDGRIYLHTLKNFYCLGARP